MNQKQQQIEKLAEKLHGQSRRDCPEHATDWFALKALGYHQGYMRRARRLLDKAAPAA